MKAFRFISAVALCAFGLAAAPLPQTPAYDLVLKGGKVLDGAGNPWFYGDVAIKAGRIAAIGSLGNATAARTIDVTGKVIAPGFIDLHSHGDGGLASMALRHAPNVVAQGITLVVVNQDGRSPRWPIRDQKALYEKQSIGPNAALMVGHGTLRSKVMGQRDNQIATDADIQAMQKLVDEGMTDGAFGLSTGLEYNPGRYSETREVVALTRMVKPYGGFYISHERSEGADPMWKVKSDPTPFVSLLDAVNETITIGRETGVPVVASHLKAKGASYWGSSQAATRLIREAREQGLEVYADQYPYETSGTDGSTVLIPGWAISAAGEATGDQLEAGGGGGRGGRGGGGRGGGGGAAIKERFKKRLGNDEDVRKIRMDIAHEIDRRGGASRIIINAYPDPKYVGKSVQFVADDLKMSAVDAAIWLQLNGADRAGGASMRGFSLSEIDLDHIMQQEFTATCTDGGIVALGDGLPHARFYGTMARKIRRFVLDRNVITLPFAIRSMTSLPAQIMGLKDRGMLRTGFWADLVVIDLETVADKATFTAPHQYPTGMPYVFVNGVAVVENGKLTSGTPGKVLTPRMDGFR
jgi:N-acyl-D-amino-acid deacylase